MSQRAFKSFGPSTWAKGHRGVLGGHASDMAEMENVRFYFNGRVGPRHPWRHRKTEVAYTGNKCPLFIPLIYKQSSTTETEGYLTIDEDGDVRWSAYSDFGIDYTDTTAFTFPGGIRDHDDPQQLWVSYIDDWTVLVNDHVISVEEQVPPVGGGPLFVSQIDFTAAPWSFSTAYHCYGSIYHNTRGFFWGDDQGESGTSVISGNMNRIYYTNAANDATPGFGTQQPPTVSFASSAQYFDIDGAVAGMASVDGNLLIWDLEGAWYVLQGRGDPADGTLLRLGKFRRPPLEAPMTVELDRQFYFLSAGHEAVTRVGAGGALDDQTFAYLKFDAAAAGFPTNDLARPDSTTIHNGLWLANEETALHMFNGVWTLESPSFITVLNNSDEDWQFWFDDRKGKEYLARSDGGTVEIYERDLSPSEPLFFGGIALPDASESPDPASANSGGVVNARIKLPRIQEDYKSVRVRRVIVDGYYHDTYYAPSYTVRAYTGDRSGTDQVTVDFNRGPTQHVSDIASITAGQEYPFRAVHTPETDGLIQFTSFTEIELRDLVSVSIEKVTVEYEINEGFVF